MMQVLSSLPYLVMDLTSTTFFSDPWFNDGNIVLQAEMAQFRVHRGVLAVHSVIFNNLFSLSGLVEGDEMVEGCAVVHLSDTAEDLQHVLKALYESRR